MSAADTYTVRVEYKADPSIYTTYNITVTSGTPPVTVNTFANVAALTGSGSTQTATWTNGDITVSAVKGGSSSAFRTTESDLTRFYTGWTITVTSAANTISSLEITCDTDAYANTLKGMTFTKGTAAASGDTVTVSGVSNSSTSVTLTAQVRIKSIKVNY